MHPPFTNSRILGTLLGTAVGDALGLVAEGMSRKAIRKRFGRIEHFGLLWPLHIGIVSDDTELSLLIAKSLAQHPDNPDACERAFKKSLVGWFARLPWGIGLATLRSCLKIALGRHPSGVMSAGNGAAMRSAVIGVTLRNDPQQRLTLGRRLAQVTHRDPRAVEGALFVAELAAALALRDCHDQTFTHRIDDFQTARRIVTDAQLNQALDQALQFAQTSATPDDAADKCGTSGFVIHTLGFVSYVWLRFGAAPREALLTAVNAGGDADSNAAILGAWLGAHHGAFGLPENWLAHLHDGPLGTTYLCAVAAALDHIAITNDPNTPANSPPAIPKFSATFALLQNLGLYPIILAHAARRIIPF